MRTLILVITVFCLIGLSACGGLPGEKQFEGPLASRMHADWFPPNSLRLAQVVHFETRAEIEKIGVLPGGDLTMYQNLKAAGISEEEIHDGSVGSGIIYCCGGDISIDTHIKFYIPDGLNVELGDIVEVKVGEPPSEGNHGTFPNFVTRVKQKVNDPDSFIQGSNQNSGCRWIPENPDLWGRVLYCRGLEIEGWIQSKTKVALEALWYKPPQP